MKGKIVINPQDILNQINKMYVNYRVQLRISKDETQNLLDEITNPLISAKTAETG